MNFSQLRTILWLRWRLTRNQWARAGRLNAVITMIVAVCGPILAVIGGVGGILIGALALPEVPPMVMLAVWDGIVCVFLFLWLFGIIAQIQRSETIDLSRMLHLPISLKEVFLVNYLASHLTLSIIIVLPIMLGLAAGLAWGRGLAMAWLFPLALGFMFMITAWTYCLRGWLAALMMNQRRRRAIIVGVTMAAVLLGQLPNLYFNVLGGRRRLEHGARSSHARNLELPAGLVTAHKYIPVLWVGNGAMALTGGNAWPAILGSAGAFVIGGLGFRRAYRSTLRFYQGQTTGKPKTKPPPVAVRAGGRNFLETDLPAVPEEAAALALATFRSLVRAPEVKMLLASNFIMLVVLGGVMLSRGPKDPGDMFKPFLATGALVLAFMGLLQVLFNVFGFDRAGFRALVLSPAPRKQILLGKNLACLPMAVGPGLIYLLLFTVAMQLSPLVLLAAVVQLIAAFLMFSMVGNFVSIMAPYRVSAGSLKPTKMPMKTTLLIFATHLLFPVALIPMAIPPVLGMVCEYFGRLPAGPVNLVSSLALAALIAWFYWLSLDGLGELLQRREKDILQVVTREVE